MACDPASPPRIEAIPMPRRLLAGSLASTFFLLAAQASAQQPPPAAPSASSPPADPAPAPPTSTGAGTGTDPADARKAEAGTPVPVLSPERKGSATPQPVEAPSANRALFEAEPVRDAAVIAIAAGFAGVLDVIQSTGEVRPQQISRDFKRENLFFLDRFAVGQTFDKTFATYSNIGLYAAIGYAVLDPIFSGLREKNVQTGIVDAVIYAESLAITAGLTNLAKIAVRRPRPRAYAEADLHKGDLEWDNSDTDSSLSFFSGHASMTAAATATATYLAFSRSPHTARPWVTLIAGTLITGVVSVGRVRSGAHFPTDVIAGAMAGAGVGILVPHFHRGDEVKQRPVWVGFAPETRGTGGTFSMGGAF